MRHEVSRSICTWLPHWRDPASWPLQVYQGIAEDTGRLDNIVELRRRALPDLPFLPPSQPAVATLTLKHAYSIIAPNTVEITFIGTNVNVDGEPLKLFLCEQIFSTRLILV